MLVGRQYPALGIFGVWGDDEPGTSGANYADATATPVEGVAARRLVEVAHDQYGRSRPLRERRQRRERPSDVLVLVRVRLAGEERHQRVDNHLR